MSSLARYGPPGQEIPLAMGIVLGVDVAQFGHTRSYGVTKPRLGANPQLVSTVDQILAILSNFGPL